MKLSVVRNLLIGVLVTILITSTSLLVTAQTNRWENNSRIPTDAFATAQVSTNFSPEQRAFIYRALEVANRLSRDKASWRRCLTSYATRDFLPGSTLAQALGSVNAVPFNPAVLASSEEVGQDNLPQLYGSLEYGMFIQSG